MNIHRKNFSMRLVCPPKTHLFWVPLLFKAGHFVQELLLSGVVSANTHSSRSSSSTSTSSLSIRFFIVLSYFRDYAVKSFDESQVWTLMTNLHFSASQVWMFAMQGRSISQWLKKGMDNILAKVRKQFFNGNKYLSFIAVKHYSLFRVKGTFCMFYRGQCRM